MTAGAIPDQPATDDVKASELQEFERLVERHQGDVFRLCFAICGDQGRLSWIVVDRAGGGARSLLQRPALGGPVVRRELSWGAERP